MDYFAYLLQRLSAITSLKEGLTLLAVVAIGIGVAPLATDARREDLLAWAKLYAAMLPNSVVLLVPAGLALLYVIH